MSRKKLELTAEGAKRPKKLSETENGAYDLEALRKREKGKVALRLDRSLIIVVDPKNNNEQYAAESRKKLRVGIY